MLYRISQAIPEENYTLRLTYTDGNAVVVHFAPLIERGGVFTKLADPDFFRRVAVSDDGRYIEWPGGLDFCADALWFEAHPEDAPAGVRNA